jgi:four helix bundle protein
MEQLNSQADHTYSYRNLDVWKRSRALTREIVGVIGRLPKTMPAQETAKQVFRSATSIGANIAEGHGRFSYAAFRSHLLIARGSATETDNWLTVLLDTGLIDEPTEIRLHRDCQTLIAALTNQIRSLNQRLGASRTAVREQPVEYSVGERDENVDELFDCSIVETPEERTYVRD